MSGPAATTARPGGGYRHEALLYSGMAEFLDGTLAFVRDGLAAGESVLVVVSAAKIARLRQALGPDADSVSFADMAEIGQNPARIIAAWHAFVAEHVGAGHRVRGVGEPVDAGRSSAELAECHLHESLLNVAFHPATPFWLLCPYDVEALAADVVDEAERNHPFCARDGGRWPSASFRSLDRVAPFRRPLPPAPPGADLLAFAAGTLAPLRRFVAERALRAGLSPDQTAELVAAVNELATNSVEHGGGEGVLRLWADDGDLVCEVSDEGHISEPLVGRLPPSVDGEGGRGLWMANQLCDLVQLRSAPDGTSLRVRMRLGSPPAAR